MAGRPTKYTPELLKKAKKYLNDYEHHKAKFPSHIGLALYLNIGTSTLYEWAEQKNKKPFTDILEEITQKQHQMLIGGGISGEFNSNITKLVLGKHGYHDKQELSTDPKNPLVPILNVSISNKS